MKQINSSQAEDQPSRLPAIRSTRMPVRPTQSRCVQFRPASSKMATSNLLLICGLLLTLLPSQSVAQNTNLNSLKVETQQTATRPAQPKLRLAQDVFRKIDQPASLPFSPPARAELNRVKTVGTNLRSFGIPFQINADNSAFIEVQLFLSRDLGSTWNFAGRQSTDRQDFPFKSTEDGEYWFSMKTLDRDRRLLPEGNPQPELKIIVDTIKPTLDFQVEADAAGRVVCRWTAKDKNLNPKSMQIFYQSTNSGDSADAWKKVPVQLNGKQRAGIYSDQIAWWPETKDRQLRVVVEIKDIAGNVAQASRMLTIQPAAWRHSSESTAQITDQPQTSRDIAIANSQQPSVPRQTAPQNNYATTQFRSPKEHFESVSSEIKVAKKTKQPAPKSLLSPAATQDTVAPPTIAAEQPDSIVWESKTKREFSKNQTNVATALPQSFPLNSQFPPQAAPRQLLARPPLDVPPTASTTKISKGMFIGESSTMGATSQYRGPRQKTERPITAPTLVPAVSNQSPTSPPSDGQYSTQPLPELPPGTENLTTTLKPAGVGDWANPQIVQPAPKAISSWQANSSSVITKKPKMDTEDQVIGSMRFDLKYAIDAIDPSGVDRVILWGTQDGVQWKSWASDPDSRSPFPVSVEQDGTYGFRIVVHSKDGLTGTGPSTGDPADIWITVDTQKPQTRINSVPYGRGREAGQLVINYSVSDSELTLRPITLAYSSTVNGPWIMIDENLSNEGRHLWKPGTDVPQKIFLMIEARDKAGNTGSHLLQQPIDISGLVPSGTISGVSVVGND